MKDRLKERRINLDAKYIPNFFGKRKRRALRKYYKNMINYPNIPLLGEELFKNRMEVIRCQYTE